MQMVSRVLYKMIKNGLPQASLIFTEAEIALDVKICSFHRGTLLSQQQMAYLKRRKCISRRNTC